MLEYWPTILATCVRGLVATCANHNALNQALNKSLAGTSFSTVPVNNVANLMPHNSGKLIFILSFEKRAAVIKHWPPGRANALTT